MTAADGDLAALQRYADELVAAVDAAIGPWVVAVIAHRHPGPQSADVKAEAEAAGERARRDVAPRLQELLTLDIDAQWTNPLSIIRSAVVYPNDVLAAAGLEPVARDAHDERINPDDIYGIAPAAFADLGPDVHEAGLVWGAAKAHVHLQRRRTIDQGCESGPERSSL